MSTSSTPRLMIANGSVFDPEVSVVSRRDVFIEEDRVVSSFSLVGSDRVIDATGLLVTPGWVDLHTHVFRGQETSIDPDLIGPVTGVTTMIDTGSAGAHLFEAFKATTLDNAKTRIRTLLNISTIGATSVLLAGELRQLDYVDEAACIDCVTRFPDEIIGIKVRSSHNVGAENSLEALRRARRVADEVGLPLMVHVGPAPVGMDAVLKKMRAGDIVTHCFSGQTDVPIARVGDEPDLLNVARAAQERGVVFDVGHGMGSFDARRVRAALEANFFPGSISSDIWAHAPETIMVGGLPHVADKMLALGMSLEDVLQRVTAGPAAAVGLDGIGVGSLHPGSVADVAAFQMARGDYEFEDTAGFIFRGNISLRPRLTVRGGSLVFGPGMASPDA